MLRDASQKQVIHKFSFIESLKLPQNASVADRVSQEIDVDQAFNFVPQANFKSVQTQKEVATPNTNIDQQDSALVSTDIKNDTIAHLPNSDPSGLDITEIVRHSALNYPPDNYLQKNHNYLGKILFALACSYCLFVVWWLFGHQGNKFVTHMMGGKHITLSKSDVKFIDSMERSLDTIERELDAKKSDSEAEKQVVYVPVYTPKNHTPTPPQTAAVAQPQPAPTEALKIPAPPPLPEPTSVAENNSPQPSATTGAIAATQPVIEHTLTGILELGPGQSAALVKVNGQTRRFWLGEEISNSGWILDSVTNQTAKINRQGQIRSIAVGETF